MPRDPPPRLLYVDSMACFLDLHYAIADTDNLLVCDSHNHHLNNDLVTRERKKKKKKREKRVLTQLTVWPFFFLSFLVVAAKGVRG